MNSIICESNVLKFQNDSINIEEKILRRNFKTLDFEKLRKRRFYVKKDKIFGEIQHKR